MAQKHIPDPKVVELLQRALDGNLGFDDLYREWPLPETVVEGLLRRLDGIIGRLQDY